MGEHSAQHIVGAQCVLQKNNTYYYLQSHGAAGPEFSARVGLGQGMQTITKKVSDEPLNQAIANGYIPVKCHPSEWLSFENKRDPLVMLLQLFEQNSSPFPTSVSPAVTENRLDVSRGPFGDTLRFH